MKGIEEFVRGYSSYMSIDGSPESVQFVENVAEELKRKKAKEINEID